MKRISSIFAVAVRQVIWKLLAVLLVLTIVQLLLVKQCLTQESFTAVVDAAQMKNGYLVAVAIATVLHCWQGMDRSGKLQYTLGRLAISEEKITLLWAMVYLGCFFVIWAWEIGMILLSWRMYAGVHEAVGLELAVTAYCNSFLHSLLPMHDWLRWLTMTVWNVTLAVSAACFGYSQRRGKLPWRIAIVFLAGRLLLRASIGSWGVDVLLLCYFAWEILDSVMRLRREENEEA